MEFYLFISSSKNTEIVLKHVWRFCILGVFFMAKYTTARVRDIRLTDGNNHLNKGILTISKDDTWGSVCGESWNITNKDVACRHLGYPSASLMKVSRNTFGSDDGPILMGDVRCNGGENNLWECDYTAEPNCSHSEDVSLVCHVPGYLGCYGNNVRDWVLGRRHFRSTALTIEHCLTFCKEEKFTLAGLQQGDCYCGTADDVYDKYGRKEEIECNQHCTGSKDQTCGGVNALAIYNVSASFCEDIKSPVGGWLKGESTFFGQTVTFGCNSGVQLIGSDVVHCILGDSSHEVKWSADQPYCFGVTAPPFIPARETENRNNDTARKSIFGSGGLIIWIVGGVAVLLLVVTILMVSLSVRSTARNRRRPEETSVDFDLEPAGASGTYRHSIHSLHLLGHLQQDNAENDKNEQKQNTAIYLREEVKDGIGMLPNMLTMFNSEAPEEEEEELEWDENVELDSDLEVNPRTSSIEYVGRTVL